MQSKAITVDQYLDELDPERKAAISQVRKVILENLPEGYEEGMQYGMIGYFVPLSLYPDGYLNDKKTPLPYVSLASQKNHMAVYMMGLYGNSALDEWFTREYEKSGKKLDMGKSCVRFRRLEDLPLYLIGEAVARVSVKDFISSYEASRKTK